MRRVLLGLAIIGLMFTPVAAFGESLFTLSGTLADGGSFNGTLKLDSMGDAYVQGAVMDGVYSFTLPTSYLGEQLGEGSVTLVDVFAVNSNFDLSLYFPQEDLTNYAGGSLCSLTTSCPSGVASSFMAPNGPFEKFETITATSAVTPEPGTLALFGTGLFGLLGAVRRRGITG